MAGAVVLASIMALPLQSTRAAEFISASDGKLSGDVILSTESTVTIRPDGGSMIMLAYDDIKLVRYPLEDGRVVEGKLHEWRQGTYVLKTSERLISVKDGVVLSEDIMAPDSEGQEEDDGDSVEAGAPSSTAASDSGLSASVEIKATADVTLEKAKEVIVDVASSRPWTDDIVVLFTTLDGTAVAGSDFTSKSGVVRLPAGETKVQLVIPLIDDDEAEDDEQLTVFLSSGPDVATISNREVVVTIRDDD